jgi:putative tryptophan/tyrosine transport system substrate-binding protein
MAADLVRRSVTVMRQAAGTLGVATHVLRASTESEIDVAFAAIAAMRAGALLVCADPFFNSRRNQIVALAARHAIPAIYEQREFAESGGLVSYGGSIRQAYTQAGSYTGRILKGEKAAASRRSESAFCRTRRSPSVSHASDRSIWTMP